MRHRPSDKRYQANRRVPAKTDLIAPAPLRVTVAPSAKYTSFIVCLHALSVFAVWQTAYLPKALLLALLLLILGSAIVTIYHSRGHSTLKWLSDEQLQWTVEYHAIHQHCHQHSRHRAYQYFCGSISQRSVHCALFILLELRDSAGKQRHCLIPKDAVSTADYRRLRARLYLRERAIA